MWRQAKPIDVAARKMSPVLPNGARTRIVPRGKGKMASQSVIDHRKTVLRARGVPERFVDALARRRQVPLNVVCSLAFFAFAIIISVFDKQYMGAVTTFLTPRLYHHQSGALLFSQSPGFGLLPMCAIFFLAAFVLPPVLRAANRKTARPFPAHDERANDLRDLQPWEELFLLKPAFSPEAFENLDDDAAFLDVVMPRPDFLGRNHLLSDLVVFLLPISVSALMATTAMDYQTVMTDKIVVYRLLETLEYRLDKADRAVILCRDYGSKPGFSYTLVYGKESFNLWQPDDLHGLTGPEHMRRLAQVDNTLKAAGVSIERLPATGSPGADANMCANRLTKGWKRADRRDFDVLTSGRAATTGAQR